MRRGTVQLLVAGLVIIAAVVLGVSWVFAGQLGEQREALAQARAEVQSLQGRLRAVETERDGLRERVAALEAALLAAGVDPQTIPAEPSPDPTATADTPSAAEAPRTGPPASSRPASPSSAGRDDSPPRPAETQPPPPPPPEEEEPEPPGPLPDETCDLLPQVCD